MHVWGEGNICSDKNIVGRFTCGITLFNGLNTWAQTALPCSVWLLTSRPSGISKSQHSPRRGFISRATRLHATNNEFVRAAFSSWTSKGWWNCFNRLDSLATKSSDDTTVAGHPTGWTSWFDRSVSCVKWRVHWPHSVNECNRGGATGTRLPALPHVCSLTCTSKNQTAGAHFTVRRVSFWILLHRVARGRKKKSMDEEMNLSSQTRLGPFLPEAEVSIRIISSFNVKQHTACI